MTSAQIGYREILMVDSRREAFLAAAAQARLREQAEGEVTAPVCAPRLADRLRALLAALRLPAVASIGR